MKRVSITFNSAENKLVVTYAPIVGEKAVDDEDSGQSITCPIYGDEVQKEYVDRATYVADWPERGADCDAMGWK